MSGGAPLHHVGIAVPSIHAIPMLGVARSIGAEVDSPVLTDPLRKCRPVLFQPSLGRRIELIEPVGCRASPITRFLKKPAGASTTCASRPMTWMLRWCGLNRRARVVCPLSKPAAFTEARIAFCYTRERVLLELAETPVTLIGFPPTGKEIIADVETGEEIGRGAG
ncbi:MAG: hypothetical protein U0231_18875 [Nitrospiraceae bacterium]